MRLSSPIRRYATAAIAACLFTGTIGAPANAQHSNSNQLKAAIVYNILRFVSIPDAGSTLTLCVDQGATAQAELRKLSGRTSRSRRIVARTVNRGSYSGCDVVYLASSTRAAVARAKGPRRLVIGEGTRFVDTGGTVGLVRTGGQVRFEVNLRESNRAGLRISSKLVRLAARVKR